MRDSPDATPLASHNALQRRYFEARVPARMLPADTPYLNRQVERVVAALALVPGERVLEIGCGMGRHTFLLARRGLRVEGLDLSPVLLERLRARAPADLEIPLHAADLQALPPGLEARFDAVVGFFMLHHVVDLDACLRGAARLLRPGGRLGLLEPNPWNPLYYVQIALSPGMTWEGDRGILRMRRGVVEGVMRGAGLAPAPTERFGFAPPFLANRRLGARLEAMLERVGPLRPLSAFSLFRATRA